MSPVRRICPAPAVPGYWLATGHGPVSESLTRFAGCEAYGVESLRDDLARFALLLGESNGEGLFSPRTPGLNEPDAIPVLTTASTASSP